MRADAWVMSVPSNTIVPLAAVSSPEMAFRIVVFPAPLAPIKATSCPRPTVSDTPFTAVTLP